MPMEIKHSIRETLTDTFQTMLMAIAIFLVVYIFLFRPFEVSGSSMYPNFVDKEYILANIVGMQFSQPQRGDVIVFHPPVAEPGRDFYIKRVMGVAGDTLMVKDGDLYINGTKQDQSSFLPSDIKTYAGSFLEEGETVTIPDGHYVVMGDNRTNSSDSREWGFITKENIIGKSLLVYWPPNEVKMISNPLQ